MALSRVWTPSPNYSGGGTKRLIVLHTTEGFTGSNGAYDCAKYFQGNVGSSSQVCIDNNRGKIYECVSRSNGAWTQCSYNSVSVSAEQCGYASWSRDYWLNSKNNLLRNTADWIAEEAKKFGIPITKISSGSAQGSGRGVCFHSDLGSAGCGHSDPGSGYPVDKVIEWAGGSSSTVPPDGGGGNGGTTAPPFPYPSGNYIGTARSDPACHSGCYGGSDADNTRTWQGRMQARGWSIGVDGCYGSQSESVCRQFQSDKNLSVDGLVGPQTWSMSWTAPIT